MDSSTCPDAGASSSLYYESFDTFLQNLSPIDLSDGGSGAIQESCQMATLPKVASNVGASDSLQGGGGGAESEVNDHQDQIKRLEDLVELLHVRLDALQRVLEIQEEEVCREVGEAADEKTQSTYEKLLTRWRREVCILILKQRVDALQVEQRQLLHTQKEQHLTVQLHEARALVEVLKQKERNSQAEIAILTTSTKMAEMNMRSEGARRQHEMEGTLKSAKRAAAKAVCDVLESNFNIMSVHLERISDASCRLDMFGKRLFFAEQQVFMAAGLISSELNPQGKSFQWRKGDAEHPQKDRKRDRAIVEQRSTMDHAGRANQLEVLLAATKTQLADECLHARELQDRLSKSEVEARESIKRAAKRAQEQSDRDLVAIKRQHLQAMQFLQQKLVKLQAEQAKGIVAHHQLERKLSHQQQEFTQTTNQRENEFKKLLGAKEIEVNGLLDEQNALLVKLKQFWRPILSSSSAKVFNEKSSRTALQTPRRDIADSLTPQEAKSEEPRMERNTLVLQSAETQTDDLTDKKRLHPNFATHDKCQECDPVNNQHSEEFVDMKDRGASISRLFTPSRKSSYGKSSRPKKKNDDDLISSYLTKLQKAYVKSEDFSNQFMSGRSLDSLLQEPPENDTRPCTSRPDTSLRKLVDQSEQSVLVQASHASQSSVDSRDFSDCNGFKQRQAPRYIICVPRSPSISNEENAYFLKPRRRKTVLNANRLLRVKLEKLEALGETLLSQNCQL